MTRDEIVDKVLQIVFETRAIRTTRRADAERKPYNISVVEDPEYHTFLTAQVMEVLDALDALNLSILEPGEYIPKSRIKLSRPDIKRNPISSEIKTPTPAALRRRLR